jgi:hypothetical protein
MAERILFEESAALAKVGQRIKTLIEFFGVPRGTFGEITRADKSGEGYTLAIQWELPERVGKPLVDWFTKGEYERYLEEF